MKKIILVIVLIALVAAVGLWKSYSGPGTVRSEIESFEEEPDKLEDKGEKIPVIITAKQSYSAGTINKLKILNEVFSSRNDNDPRLDSEFSQLSAELKGALRESYHLMPKESLNERGTVVFLLGRKIETEEDVDFLQEVLSETPCLSLADCSTEAKLEDPEDDHLVESQETTLIYPQLMSLRLLSSNYQASQNPKIKEKITEAFRVAAQSNSEYLSEEAARIRVEADIGR